jgi:hypothetical protein
MRAILDHLLASASFERLAEAADRLLAQPLPTITVRPEPLPHQVSDDERDYVSVGTYWWPDPDTVDGLPYRHRDGEFSPMVARFDRLRLDHTLDALRLHLLCKTPVHVARAAAIVRANFLDPTTRMNPHLRNAQHVPGVDDGRLVGVIDLSIRLPAVLDAARAADVELPVGFNGWCGEMLDWLLTPRVREWHDAATNNLGVWYDVLVANLARQVGRDGVAVERALFTLKRETDQIDGYGRLPEELKRTRSFDYATMTAWGMLRQADLAVAAGEVSRATALAVGTPLRMAINYLVERQHEWPHEQIGGVDPAKLRPTLVLANALAGERFYNVDDAGVWSHLGAHPWHPPKLGQTCST